jgi:WD40 repeat protein
VRVFARGPSSVVGLCVWICLQWAYQSSCPFVRVFVRAPSACVCFFALGSSVRRRTPSCSCVCVCASGVVCLWDALSGRPLCDPLTSSDKGVTCLCTLPSPPGGPSSRHLLILGCGDGTVQVLTLVQGVPTGPPMVRHGSPVRAMCAGVWPGQDPRQLLLVAGEDKALRLWDLGEEGVVVPTALGGYRGHVTCAALPGDGATLFTGACASCRPRPLLPSLGVAALESAGEVWWQHVLPYLVV